MGDFYEHFVALNYLKMYYGEKFAFEFAFLIHYQAWLVFPAVGGIIVTMYQAYLLNTLGLEKAIDSSVNGLFGIFICIWSTFFIESWKTKQKII
jgi:hypothetical protein